MALADACHRVLALPTVGLTLAEMEEAQRAHSLGLSPHQIRAIWQPDELARLERKRLKDDPDGYGRSWNPYKTLGGIEWHGGRFEKAVEYYEQAEANGATVRDIGSQLSDSLMHAGRYRDAQRVAERVNAEGPNEWRDVFREAILFELVDVLGLRRQQRHLRTTGGTVDIDDESTRQAYDYLRTTDALDMPSWAVIAQDDPAEARISRVMACAYLGDADEAWFLLALAAHSWSDDEVMKPFVIEALSAQSPETHEFIRNVLNESDSEHAAQVLAFFNEHVL